MITRTSEIEQKRCGIPKYVVKIALTVEVQGDNIGNDQKSYINEAKWHQ